MQRRNLISLICIYVPSSSSAAVLLDGKERKGSFVFARLAVAIAAMQLEVCSAANKQQVAASICTTRLRSPLYLWAPRSTTVKLQGKRLSCCAAVLLAH